VRWYQVGVKSLRLRLPSSKNTCKIRICRSGTPYEQDLEHTLSLCPLQLYSLDTVFGQQGAEAQDGRSTILGCTSLGVRRAVAEGELDRLRDAQQQLDYLDRLPRLIEDYLRDLPQLVAFPIRTVG
jgi:hypothetical protein